MNKILPRYKDAISMPRRLRGPGSAILLERLPRKGKWEFFDESLPRQVYRVQR